MPVAMQLLSLHFSSPPVSTRIFKPAHQCNTGCWNETLRFQSLKSSLADGAVASMNHALSRLFPPMRESSKYCYIMHISTAMWRVSSVLTSRSRISMRILTAVLMVACRFSFDAAFLLMCFSPRTASLANHAQPLLTICVSEPKS